MQILSSVVQWCDKSWLINMNLVRAFSIYISTWPHWITIGTITSTHTEQKVEPKMLPGSTSINCGLEKRCCVLVIISAKKLIRFLSLPHFPLPKDHKVYCLASHWSYPLINMYLHGEYDALCFTSDIYFMVSDKLSHFLM